MLRVQKCIYLCHERTMSKTGCVLPCDNVRGDKFNYQGCQGEVGMEMGGGQARAGAKKVIIVDSINIPSEAGSSSSIVIKKNVKEKYTYLSLLSHCPCFRASQ